MKKTLVAILGLSSFVIASGKVELVNEAKATVVTPGTEKKVVFNEKKDLKVTHKLKANIKENNILAEIELGTSAKLVDGTDGKKTYEFGKAVTGFVKAGYDNGKLASSLKYDFAKKETFLNASYKYTDGKLTLKPNAELMFEVLDPAKLTLANESSYKFDDVLTLKNESKFYTTVYGMNVDAPKYVKTVFEIEKEKSSMFGLNSKFGVEYKPTDEVKLLANVFGKFENGKYVSTLNRTEKTLEAKIDAKSEFESKTVKGLKSDAKLVYGFTKKAEKIDSLKYEGLSKKHSFELDSNVSYLVDLTNGFELTPAFNLNYKFSADKLYDTVDQTKGEALLKENTLTLKPSTKLEYKLNKFTTSLNLETPFEFTSRSLKLDEEAIITALDDEKIDSVHKFKFDKGSLKATLSLSYKW